MQHHPEPSPSSADTERLVTHLRGEVITRESPRYDEVRKLYNGMIDKRPRTIVRCRDVADVVSAVRHGRRTGMLTAIRGGGHNGPGLASCDDGLVIDLSPMRGILVDPHHRTATVQAGATWGDFDHATHVFGLTTSSGVISTTGVAGLTLGGGHGYLARKYDLTIDNLISATVVLADGTFVEASEDENPDLFWALRGGGGNFGVVTSFRYRLHPVNTVFGGPTFWPIEAAGDVLRWYDAFLESAPNDIYGFFAMLTVPPVAPFPEPLHGKKVCGVVWCCLGEDHADAVLAATKKPAKPVFEHVGEMPFPALQTMHDPLYPPGLEWYWRGHFIDALSDDAIDISLKHGARLPTGHSTAHFYPVDGAVHDVAEDATAFSYRSSRYSTVIVGVDPDPANRQIITDWTKAFSDELFPHTAEGGYVNFMMEEGPDRLKAAYRGNYERLVAVKKAYDPDNFFRVNQNIPPTG